MPVKVIINGPVKEIFKDDEMVASFRRADTIEHVMDQAEIHARGSDDPVLVEDVTGKTPVEAAPETEDEPDLAAAHFADEKPKPKRRARRRNSGE